MEDTVKALLKHMPVREMRRNIKKNLKTQYIAGVITKHEYKKAKKKLKVIIRGL